MNFIAKAVGGFFCAVVLPAGIFINSQRETLLENATAKIESIATEAIGTPVKIGDWKINDSRTVIVRDVEVLDKNTERIAKVDEAEIKLKFLSLYNDGVGAIDEINIDGAEVDLKKRGDETWNFDDIKVESEGESNFGAKISLNNGKINADFDDKNISVEEISAVADCKDLDAIETNLTAKTLGSQINASGVVGSDKQIVNAKVDEINLSEVVKLLPEGTLPENIEIRGGTVKNPVVNVLRRGEVLSYSGSADFSDGTVKVLDTEIENISGSTTFTDAEIFLNTTASSGGQIAKAYGTIRTDTDEPFFNVHAESESFNPAKIIASLGVDGDAKFTAHMVGTVKNPQVEADISSDAIAYENISARNLKTHLNYADDAVYFSNFHAETFGGIVNGDFALQANDLSYNGHIKATGIDTEAVQDAVGNYFDVGGKISADVGLNGVGKDLQNLKIYGEATADSANYKNFIISSANTSFFLDGDDLTLDYLNAKLPNRGTVGLEGTIMDLGKLDLKFHAAHVDLSLAENLNENLDLSGLSDFIGEVHGDLNNPDLKLELSAIDFSKHSGKNFAGGIFKQPYDSVKLSAAGSLDGVHINKFELVRDGTPVWQIENGTVGLTGEKKINVTLKTNRARVESIMALIAPDENLTGNIDNVVTVTGTLNNPHVVGHVDFKYGSYNGILLTTISGDYFIENEIVRLQNFEVTSPMADAVLDGTFNTKTKALDFTVLGSDLSLKRFQSKFPKNYPVEGHGKFEGTLTGTQDHPIFSGIIDAPNLNFNGVQISDVYGHININGENIVLDEFKFNQGDGNYKMFLGMNTALKGMNGKIDVENVDISELFKLAGQQNKFLNGKLNSTIIVGGSVENPSVNLSGDVSKGDIAGYDIHDLKIEMSLLNNIIYVTNFKGYQNESGELEILGTADLNGPLDLNITAQKIALGIFGGLAEVDTEITGTADAQIKIGGVIDNPQVDSHLTASGSIAGATFDLLQANIDLKNWVFEVKELFVERMIAETNYRASVQGTIPYAAINRKFSPSNEQVNLKISLDDADLSLLPQMSNYIAWAVGDMDGEVLLTGTFPNLKANGQISVNDGTVQIKGMKNQIDNINISTLFKGERYDIENFTANVGDGNLELTGGFDFGGMEFKNYNFDLVLDNLGIKSDVFNGPLNAEFNLKEGKIFRKYLPKITGHIELDDCTIGIPSIPDSDDPLPEILLDISLNLGNKVHFYSSHLVDMFFTGSARFEGTTAHPKSSGLITARRGGTLTYLQTVFDVKEAEANFNQMGTFFPTIHFSADTKIGRTKVNLLIDGSLENVRGTKDNSAIKLSSVPEMTQTEIIQLLTLREAYQNGESNFTAADALAIGLQMSILGDIEDAVRKTLGFDRFVFARGSASAFQRYVPEEQSKREPEYNVSIGKYVSDKVMLKLTQGINGDHVTRYGLQYDLNENIGITVERERNEFVFGLEANYKF